MARRAARGGKGGGKRGEGGTRKRPRRTGRVGSTVALAVVACVAVALVSLRLSSTRVPPPTPVLDGGAAEPPTFLGLDLHDYPGDAAMRRLRRDAPYRFVGYYLRAPNHPDRSWMGTWRSRLQGLGFHVAILYVGQQRDELDETQARLDADEAAQEAEGEGFPEGAVIYLDVEAVDSVGPDLARYVRAFTARLDDDGRFRPGLYCHVKNAADLVQILDRARRRLPLWVAGATDRYTLGAPPSASGVPQATLWQGLIDVKEPTSTIPLTVDVSSSVTPAPSGF